VNRRKLRRHDRGLVLQRIARTAGPTPSSVNLCSPGSRLSLRSTLRASALTRSPRRNDPQLCRPLEQPFRPFALTRGFNRSRARHANELHVSPRRAELESRGLIR
jgi:hypothetical protein